MDNKRPRKHAKQTASLLDTLYDTTPTCTHNGPLLGPVSSGYE